MSPQKNWIGKCEICKTVFSSDSPRIRHICRAIPVPAQTIGTKEEALRGMMDDFRIIDIDCYKPEDLPNS